MGKKILLGTENFEELIKGNGYYVDKTELIHPLVEEVGNKVTLFTRPRRFGKTLTMRMLESFFSNKIDSGFLFKDLSIFKNHPEFCTKWMNKYPTIFISFKDVEGLTFDKAYKKLELIIANICMNHAELEFNENVSSTDKQLFHKLLDRTATEADLIGSLKTIMRMMHAAYGQPTILLIDEYDVPLAKAHVNGYYREMLDFIRSLMGISLKTNDYLNFAIVTGCLRVPKESIFTGLNNFATYSVLDRAFSNWFGFTQIEVEKLLDYFGLTDKLPLIQTWYDGYIFGNTEIYCPWDVMSYISDLCLNENASPQCYWENTSSNDAIKAFFEIEDADYSDKFESLLNGKTITQTVSNTLTYDEVYHSEDNLWSILLMTGYLTLAETTEPLDAHGGASLERNLRIPNREVAGIFQRTVVDHFNRTVDNEEIKKLMAALWQGDAKKASKLLSDLLWQTISYMDYHENYYHAFLTGIFAGRGGYAVQSNKERGLGRPDIDIRDKKNRRAIIIEAKKAGSKEEMAKCCEDGLQQIKDKEYAKNMDEYREVLCYGVAFFRKWAMVRRLH